MAQWYHLFGLLSVLCMSFGALYIVFNSEYNEVCDYSDTVDSCMELKEYKETDMEWETKQLLNDYLRKAQELRNSSEIEKCGYEEELLKEMQITEKEEAEVIARQCMEDFKDCVRSGYTTTTAAPVPIDCSDCNRFCDAAKWDSLDLQYAQDMNFSGYCSNNVCPWLPDCGEGQHIHTKCSMRGCPCEKALCKLTTTTTTTRAPTTAPLFTTTFNASAANTTPAFLSSSTTTSTTTGRPTTTAKPTTSTTTRPPVTTPKPTTTVGTTAAPYTGPTTTTTRRPTTTTTIRTTTTTTTTTEPGCYCKPGTVDTVLVGRPHKTFDGIDHSFDAESIRLMQGVFIENYKEMAAGLTETRNCLEEFRNRSNYVIARKGSKHAAANHFDLSCGYSGTMQIRCEYTPEVGDGTCALAVDISTCQPPTYSQALDECYEVPTTTPVPDGPTMPNVPDWLGVEDLPFQVAEMPQFFNISTQKTTPAPCCEVHVGSTCRTDQEFEYPAKTVKGRWDPGPAYNRKAGYFPVTTCEDQAAETPRACPMVRIKITNEAWKQWPHCLDVCSDEKAQVDLKTQICNKTSDMEREKAVFKKKLESMKAKRAVLEEWVTDRMITVKEMKIVTDCFADKLPRRYNAMALPKMRSGFEKMPLHNQCRLHSCTAQQCLEVTRKCKVPFVHEEPESFCSLYEANGTFTCVDKIEIMSNNPLSLGFGIAWMVMGGLFACCGLVNWIRGIKHDVGPHDQDTLGGMTRLP